MGNVNINVLVEGCYCRDCVFANKNDAGNLLCHLNPPDKKNEYPIVADHCYCSHWSPNLLIRYNNFSISYRRRLERENDKYWKEVKRLKNLLKKRNAEIKIFKNKSV